MKLGSSLSLALVAALFAPAAQAAAPKIPIVHSTDLFHPHADPDDHYDLATLFALEEFDVRGIVLDLGADQAKRPGRPAVEQAFAIAGRRCPVAIGLSRPLRSRGDAAADEPAEFQQGVDLVLRVLRESNEKVVLHTTGSCRDVAAAFNREPRLLREKVAAVYFNIGRGPGQSQDECNVGYDPASYLRMFETGLPLYWCPCFGKDGYETLFEVDQPTVVGVCPPRVRNFFVYCLNRSKADPLAFLATGPHPLPTGPRAMWCTAPMFHAAGRKIYERAPGDFAALRAEDPRAAGLKPLAPYAFVPVRVRVEADMPTAAAAAAGTLAATWQGRTGDRVGTARPEPDGRVDCQVRVVGIDSRPIANLVLTGPNEGRWELVETGRWWRLASERQGDRLDCFFQFYAAGRHRLEIVLGDGARRTVEFDVPAEHGLLHAEPAASDANALVFRSVDPRYKRIMASCLKNLLAEWGK